MKDGRTHLAHKAEHAVDLDTQALVAVQVTGADEGDTSSLSWTLIQSDLNLQAVSQDPKAKNHLHGQPMSEVVTDKGVSQQRHDQEAEGRSDSRLPVRARPGAPSVEGPGRPGGRVCQSTPDSRAPGPRPATASSRMRGTQFRSHLRTRGAATDAPAGPRQHLQAAEPSWQRLQSGLGHAEAHRLRDPEGSAGTGGRFFGLQGGFAGRSGPLASRRRPLPHLGPGSIPHPLPPPSPRATGRDPKRGFLNGLLDLMY